jgi:sortase (surface protein transpeptidase)
MSIALVILGIVLIIVALHGPRVGPNLRAPVGNTSVGSTSESSPSGAISRQASYEQATAMVVSATPFVGAARGVTPAQPAARVSHGDALNVEGGQAWSTGSTVRSSRDSTTTTVARSVPVHLSIPSLGISVRLSQLGLTASGAVQVPASFSIPGWYDQGYAPGQVGSAAILGHVDSTSGPGVFYRIVDMKVGQRVQVSLSDGQRLTFAVIGLRQYSKNGFPNKLIYGPNAHSELNLVTCGGTFDAKTHHYLSNIVVFTTLVKVG